MTTAAQLKKLFPSARADLISAVAEGWGHMVASGINTSLDISMFIATLATETGGFRAIEENMKYSAKRLTEVWPSRFKTLAAAKPYASNPEKLANKVYGGRLGNGNEKSGDGWRYRGSGMIQTTGKFNFAKAGFQDSPDSLRKDPRIAFTTAVKFWVDNRISAIANKGDAKAVRKAVNGGTHGLAEFQSYLAKCRKVFKDEAVAKAPVEVTKPSPPPMTFSDKDTVMKVQRDLREKGFYQTGEIDGDLAPKGRTEGAILDFRNKNDLPLTPVIDAQFLEVLKNAPKVPVEPARAQITSTELMKKDTSVSAPVKTAWWTKFGAWFGGGTAVVGAAGSGASSLFTEAANTLEPARNFLYDMPFWVWGIAFVAVAVALWLAANKIQKSQVEMYKKGEVS